MAARSQFAVAMVPARDQNSFRAMRIDMDGGQRVILKKSEMQELLQLLMREARNLEDICCWHGCRKSGSLYRIRGITVRATRFYCDHHATAVELSGFRVFPVDIGVKGHA